LASPDRLVMMPLPADRFPINQRKSLLPHMHM
jgi:hypothetical protein